MRDVYKELSLDMGVAFLSFLLFLFLSRSVVLYLRRSTAEEAEMEDGMKGSLQDRRQVDHSSEFRNNLLAEVPGQFVVSVGGVVVAVAVVVTTEVLAHPLSTSGYSRLLHYGLLVCIGHHAYRLLACLVFCASRHTCTSFMGHSVALVAFTTVTFTKEDAMLGVTGLLYQTPFVLFMFEDAACEGRERRTRWTPVSLAAAVVFMVVLPASSTVYSMVRESIPRSLSIWSNCVTWLAVVYFGLVAIWTVAARVVRCARYFCGPTTVRDTTPLLVNIPAEA